jgi:hypothetical protein
MERLFVLHVLDRPLNGRDLFGVSYSGRTVLLGLPVTSAIQVARILYRECIREFVL